MSKRETYEAAVAKDLYDEVADLAGGYDGTDDVRTVVDMLIPWANESTPEQLAAMVRELRTGTESWSQGLYADALEAGRELMRDEP
jgi:hypothetical protein